MVILILFTAVGILFKSSGGQFSQQFPCDAIVTRASSIKIIMLSNKDNKKIIILALQFNPCYYALLVPFYICVILLSHGQLVWLLNIILYI